MISLSVFLHQKYDRRDEEDGENFSYDYLHTFFLKLTLLHILFYN